MFLQPQNKNLELVDIIYNIVLLDIWVINLLFFATETFYD